MIQDQIDIITLELNDDDSEQLNEREQFESNYFKAAPDADVFLKSNDNSSQLTDNLQRSSIMQSKTTVKFPEFVGSYSQWPEYSDLFTSLVHKNEFLSNVTLHYLNASVTGEAFDLISSLATTSANYTIAWDSLVNRFDDRRAIISEHINLLMEMGHDYKQDGQSIRNMIASIKKHLQALNALGVTTENWDPILVHIVTRMLDDKSNPISSEYPTFDELAQFLTTRCRVLESIEIKNKITVPEKTKFISKGAKLTKSTPHISTNNSLSCAICIQTHHLYACDMFKGLTIPERISKINI